MSDEEIQKCLVFGWRAVIVGSVFNKMFENSFHWLLNILIKWARDENNWIRNTAGFSIHAPVERKIITGVQYVKSLRVLDLLMQDTDRNVKKKVGWTLRVGSKFFPKETYNFLFHWAKTENKDTKWIIKNGMKFIDENKQKILLKMLSNC